MDSLNYEKQKKLILGSLHPYRILDKAEIVSNGNNFLRINGNDVEVTSEVQRSIDRFIGVSKRQAEAMKVTYGDKSLTDLRNWFALAGDIEGARKIALIADPKECKVVGTSPIKRDIISPDAFFDFVEIFMDRNRFYPHAIKTGVNGVFGINITLKPINKQIKSFGPNEDFLTNGIYFRWNLGELEAGNYIERLVCSNGQTATFPHKMGIIHDLATSSVNKLLQLPANQKVMNFNYEVLQKNALIAQKTVASLSEVNEANQLLVTMGVENNIAEEIAPINYLLDLYETAGYKVRHIKQEVATRYQSDILFWDLFNRLTHFASHTEQWEENDIRRHVLMSKCFQFLNKTRDIQELINIFS